MSNKLARPKSGPLKSSPPPHGYRTFDDWQAEQEHDLRTPGQCSISVGSPVRWRRRNGRVIVTERAAVVANQTKTAKPG